jgi:hypothetical protein
LLKLIKKHSKTNMRKFEMYALRNVFASSTQAPSSSSSSSSQPPSPPSAELEALRSRYAELSAENSFLRDEAVASEALLGQMSKSIFDLRVGAQVLDTYDVKPLADSVAGVAQSHRDLAQLSDRARCECSCRPAAAVQCGSQLTLSVSLPLLLQT